MNTIVHINFKRVRALVPLLLLFFLSPISASPLPALLSAEDFVPQDEQQVELGRLLFYDKILSGNKNISCGTCHHHKHFGSDGLSLGIGEGGSGIGPDRQAGEGASRIRRRIPRNAPALWNLGAKDIEILFHDGRLSASDDYGTGFNSPAEEWLPQGLSGLLAAQALFPLASRFEMAGGPHENSVARAAFDRIDHVWPIITQRIKAIPEYVELFSQAFEHIKAASDIGIVDVANALAAFETTEWQSYDSPFDDYLAGDVQALNSIQKRGMDLFFGKAACANCHSGKLFSDQKFHAIGLPVFGPGRTRVHDPIPRDTGRMAESDLLADSYRFRTPSLRNVELTSPYGHNGAYKSLSQIVRHHLDPEKVRSSWSTNDAILPDIDWLNSADLILLHDKREMARYNAKLDLKPQQLDNSEVEALVLFLKSLTGKTARDTQSGAPLTVPSGLPVDHK